MYATCSTVFIYKIHYNKETLQIMVQIELQSTDGQATTYLTRKIVESLDKAFLTELQDNNIELQWSELTFDDWKRPQTNKQVVQTSGQSEASKIVRILCKYLPAQYSYVKLITLSSYVDPKDKLKRTKTVKSIGRTFYANEYRNAQTVDE